MASNKWIDPQNPLPSPIDGFNMGDLVWARPEEIGDSPSLFIDGAEEGDVCQGALGDCWFLGALSVLGMREDLLFHVVVQTEPQLGWYDFQFFKEGKWKKVRVDDRIPCRKLNNGTFVPLYARSPDPNEMWVCLMEKAYAKLHNGRYDALDGGQVDYALVDLTGGVTDSSDLSTMKPEEVWTKLIWAVDEQWLMGCAHLARGATAESELGGTGLLVNHAYGIIDARIVRGERLLRIRNPWGKTEWTGRWSDNSSEWTPDLLAELNFELADDGTFWMALEDFMLHYNKLYVVRLYHDEYGKIWQRHMIDGGWQGPTAGGCVNNASWISNPQFGFTAAGNGPVRVFIQLSQADVRLRNATATTIGFIVFSSEDNTKRTVNAYQKDVKLSPTYSNARDVNHEFVAEPGVLYVLMVSTFDAGVAANFNLAIWSEDPIHVHELPPASNSNGPVTVVPPRALNITSGVDADDLQTGAGAQRKKAPPKMRVPKTRSSVALTTRAPSVASSSFSNTSAGPYTGSRDATGLPHGKGTYRFENADTYDGDFVHGERTGSGTYRFGETNDVYTGEFEKNHFHGQGTMVYASGDRYAGTWKNGHREGQGKFVHQNGDHYEGSYKHSQKSGHGIMRFANGDVQEAEFERGVANGEGTFRFANGNVYEGTFENGEFSGHGKLTQVVPEAGLYEGGFRRGMRHGRGLYQGSDGDRFEGEYRENLMHDGTFQRKNGDVYVGSFLNGVPHGQGTYTTSGGRVIQGQFQNGRLPQ